MNRDALKRAVLDALAPELAPSTLAPGEPLREQRGLDSLDFLQCPVTLDHALGVSIPESDSGQLATIDGAVDSVERRRAAPG